MPATLEKSTSILNELQITSLGGIFFFAPMSVAGMNISGALFLILSLIKFIFTKKLENKVNSTIKITIIFAAWIFLSAWWSPSLKDAEPTLKSLWWYALLPVGILTINWTEKFFKFIVLSFICGNAFNASFFIIQLLEIIPKFHYDAKYGLVGFGNRVYLAMLAPPSIIILINDIKERYFISNLPVISVLTAVMIFELTWSTGRTSQLILIILLLLYFASAIIKIKKIFPIIIGAVIAVIFIAPHIIDRWQSAFDDVRLYISGDAQTNLGLRLAFWDASIQTFLAHPLLGVGAGGYTPSFHNLMALHKVPIIGSEWFWAVEPHNSYLAILAEYGAVGFIIFIFLIFDYYKSTKIDRNKHVGKFKALILLTFILASFSDSFIWRWQGMMILLSTFSISVSIQSKRNV